MRGIKLKHNKNTQSMTAQTIALPAKVRIPLLMGIGAPSELLVKTGDNVLRGQKLAAAANGLSLPIHSGVSGTVTGISDYLMVNGKTCKLAEIEPDGKQIMSGEIKPPSVNDKESFLSALQESGLCGLGGAGFPTYAKLSSKSPVDTLIVNAAECEPYITADYRLMIDTAEDVISGIRAVMKYTGITRAIIAVENNKPKAAEKFSSFAKDGIEVLSLPSQYPQGAEKVIIYNTVKRTVKSGQFPADVGVAVLNVSTAAFIHCYLKSGIPLIEKTVTVDGDAVNKPCNVTVPIGTPIADILKFAEVTQAKKIIAGGVMMGQSVYTDETPITKTANAVLAFKTYDSSEETACIRCGKCISACPLKLMPMEFANLYKMKNTDRLKKLNVSLCMNCGCCSYVCPAKRRLSETNQLAKQLTLSS